MQYQSRIYLVPRVPDVGDPGGDVVGLLVTDVHLNDGNRGVGIAVSNDLYFDDLTKAGERFAKFFCGDIRIEPC